MDDDDFISKSQRKRDATALQVLGKGLVALSAEQLARIDMPEELREAVLACKRFTRHEAIRRQQQYIGRIMRDLDAEPIAAQLAAMHAPSNRQTALFHVAERWRKELLADPGTLARFAQEFPGADAKQLRTLVEKAGAERDAGRAPKHFRELFHVLNAMIQAQAKP